MGLSSRIFLLDQHDDLYRLPSSWFDQMLRDPASHPLPRFAGSRVRITGVVVELLDRQAIRVIRSTFSLLTFDSEGNFDPGPFDRHQRALAEQGLAPLIAETGRAMTVIDAANRFIARGVSWAPSNTLAQRIEQVALGREKCKRL